MTTNITVPKLEVAIWEAREQKLLKLRQRAELSRLPGYAQLSPADSEATISGRIGDLAVLNPVVTGGDPDVECRCGCGVEMTLRASYLSATLDSIPMPETIPLLAGLEHLPPARQTYWCEHLEKELKEAFPELAEYRRKAMVQIKRVRSRKQKTEFSADWVSRSTGTLAFLRDIGMPPATGYFLKRAGFGFLPASYLWESEVDQRQVMVRRPHREEKLADPHRPPGLSENGEVLLGHLQIKKLGSRFTSMKTRAKSQGRQFAWPGFREFLSDLRDIAPPDFTPEKYQIRFDDAAVNGYCRASMRFITMEDAIAKSVAPQTKGRGQSQSRSLLTERYTKLPWNAVSDIEEMARTWPLYTLDLSAWQYPVFLQELTRLMSTEVGDIYQHLQEAKGIASAADE